MHPHTKTLVRASLFFGCCLLLSACGTKGSLTLPPKDINAPAPAKVASPAKPAADDNSAPPATAAQ
jgi:predicted small lipoprotein YifL